MQLYYVYTKKGERYQRHSPCYGTLSCLDQVYWGDKPEVMHPKELDYLVVCPNETNSGNHHPDIKLAADAVKGLIESGTFPQYLSHISFPEKVNDLKSKNMFKVQLAGGLIQPSMIGAFMVRNSLVYFSKRSVFVDLLKEGCDTDIAFVLSNIFDYSMGGFCGDSVSYYIGDGDGSIFGGEARIIDVISMFRGETWNNFSGEWGDLDCGYPRYGYIDSDGVVHAPRSERTGRRMHLTDTTLSEKDYKGSQYLYSFFEELSGDESGRIPREVFIEKVVPAFTEYVRESLKDGSV